MDTEKETQISVDIPSVGKCTLISFYIVPEMFRTYEDLLKTAKMLDLKELPELSHSNIQEIFKTLAYELSKSGADENTNITILLSGAHDSYPFIDCSSEETQKESCVTGMSLIFWGKMDTPKADGDFKGSVEIKLEEIPINELFLTNSLDEKYYCLFLEET